MIEITLHELNKSYKSLEEVSSLVNKGKLKYRLGRLLGDAKKEMELFGEHLKTIAETCGGSPDGQGGFSFGPEQKEALKSYIKESDDFAKRQTVELWGKPEFFTETEFEPFDLSAKHISDLLWLIGDSGEDVGKPKSQAASA